MGITLGKKLVVYECFCRSKMKPSPFRWLWEFFGWVFLGLGFLGIPLPLLPTTPFVLLALFAFSKSRPTMKAWILQHHLIGPPVRRWKEKKGISAATRYSALGTVLFSFSLSIWLLQQYTPVVSFLALGCLTLLFFIFRIPIVEDDSPN